MFGNNPLMKSENNQDGSKLRVVQGSPFLTIQGEGPSIGRPAVFLRLHGCNLACTFCDTQFSDPEDPWMDLETICQKIQQVRNKANLTVITGGEPLRQNITPLCQKLRLNWMKVQIETAGTLWVPGVGLHADIVCSPKTPTINAMVLANAVAFKYVVDIQMEFDGFLPITATQAGARPARLAAPRPGAPVYLSPMDTGDEARNATNRRLVGQLALAHGCIAGIQLHKFIGVD